MKTCSQCRRWGSMDQETEIPSIGFCTAPLPMIIENQSRLDNTTNADDNAEDCNCYIQIDQPVEITDDDIFTRSNVLEILFKSHFRVTLHTTDEGMVVDIHVKDQEEGEAIASCYAFDSEVGDGDDVEPFNEEGA